MSISYKCLNPDCRHQWDTRGDYAKILRCPMCRKGYVLDWESFEEAVRDEKKWLKSMGHYPDEVASHLATRAMVVRKLFPMLPFDAFQVISDEARK